MNPPRPRLLSVASVLFWLLGLLLLASAGAIGYPALVVRGTSTLLVTLAVWGAAYLSAGFALSRRLWGVRWWGSALAALSALALLAVPSAISVVGVALNLAALVLILCSWHALAQASVTT